MNRKLRAGVMLLILASMLAGCAGGQMGLVVPEQQNNDIKVADHIPITEEMFYDLFTDYFSLSEEDMLVLNQKPKEVNDEYVEAYEQYAKKVETLFGDILSDDAVVRLNSNYMTGDFHLPKKLEFNGYVTYGTSVVEGVEIGPVQYQEDIMVYEVVVTTLNKVEPATVANTKYKWDDAVNYYVEAEETDPENPAFSEMIKNVDDTYLYAEADEDMVRLKHTYWVEVFPTKELKIEGIKEVSSISVANGVRQKASNTQHIERVPFVEEVTEEDETLIKQVFGSLLYQPKDFYEYYETAYATGYDTFKAVWENELGLKGMVNMTPSTYKNAFSVYMNPYKDKINGITAQMDYMGIIPSRYATKEQSRYTVIMPAAVTLANNQSAYGIYEYSIGIENGKVEFIAYDRYEKLSEEEFNQFKFEYEKALEQEKAREELAEKDKQKQEALDNMTNPDQSNEEGADTETGEGTEPTPDTELTTDGDYTTDGEVVEPTPEGEVPTEPSKSDATVGTEGEATDVESEVTDTEPTDDDTSVEPTEIPTVE